MNYNKGTFFEKNRTNEYRKRKTTQKKDMDTTYILKKNINGCEDPDKKHYLLTIYELYAFRSVVCGSHLQGKCKDSDRCPYSHCLTWQRRNPNEHYYSPKLCPEICFIKNNEKMNLIRRCKKGKLCTFAHSKEEQLYHPLMYKTKECSLYPNCNRYYCPFSHGIKQIRTSEMVRESIEEVMKNGSDQIFKNPYLLLSNMGKSTQTNDDEVNNNLNNFANSKNWNKKDTSLKIKETNPIDIDSNNNFEVHNINSIWNPTEDWNFNSRRMNFESPFINVIPVTEDNRLFMNNDLNTCTLHEFITDNKYETEYDQIWKEISTECNEKREN